MFDNPRLHRNRRINLNDEEEEIPDPPKLERSHSSLIPFPIHKSKRNDRMNEYMKNGVIPIHPDSTIITGSSGSGKTCCLLWLLSQPHLLGSYFDKTNIFLYAFSGKCDKSFNELKIPKNNIITSDMISKLGDYLTKRQAEVETKGIENTEDVLLVFEDISSNPKLLRDKTITKIVTAARHINCSVIMIGHKYTIFSRVVRLNAHNVIIFPASNSEMEQIIDEYAPPRVSKREFKELIEYAWTPDEQLVRPFLYINTRQPFRTRYRKGFNEILELDI